MENVIKGSAVDFEKVASLDGTYVLNKFVSEHDKKTRRSGSIEEFDESDIVAYENKKNRLGRPMNGGDGQNKK
jgi:hypothetical protein